jgi:Na+-driven multidrug efflux pump
MGIYRDIGILEVARVIASITMVIIFVICLFLFPIFFRYGNDAIWMALVVTAVVGAITYLAFSNHEFNTSTKSNAGETKNKHAGRRKHRKSR